MLGRSDEGSLSLGWSRERGAGGGAFRAGAARERCAVDLLAHLAELDERRLYLDLGFTSLFAYCTEALGFCKSSAGRRIAVARVCKRYPEAFARVARGELQLSVLSLLGQHLNAEKTTGAESSAAPWRFADPPDHDAEGFDGARRDA